MDALTRSEERTKDGNLVDDVGNRRKGVLVEIDDVLQQSFEIVVAVVVCQALVTTEISKDALSSIHVVPKAP